jgi:peptidoglycan hydrolase CwlO-like protein
MKSEIGVIVATVIVAIIAIVFGVMAYMNNGTLEGATPGDSKQAQIDDNQKKVDGLKDQLDLYQAKADKFQGDITQAQADIDQYTKERKNYEDAYTRRTKLVQSGNDFGAKAKELTDTLTEKKTASLTIISNEKRDNAAESAKRLDDLKTLKENAQKETDALTAEFDKRVKSNRAEMNYQKSKLADVNAQLADLTQREPERAFLLDRPDGKVVASDPLLNTVVINLGTGQGVKNGYRFEVYTIRPGAKHKTRGYVEVVKAGETQSQCMVLNYPIEMPVDKLADYVGSAPEEAFSPITQSGQKGTSINRMTETRTVNIGPSKLDPILEGDLIENPFFEFGRTLTFYIAGSKEMVGERQKSAIRYTWLEIKAAAERYGAKVVDTIDTNVNYVIAQKNPQDDPEYRKAVDFGIPIVHEWELFRFLDNR